MTQSPSEPETVATEGDEAEATPEVDPLQEYADSVAEAVGGSAELHFGTVKVLVSPDSWESAHLTARDQLDLVFFSWLSAIDWSNDVAAGDSLSDEVDEHIELMTTVGDLSAGQRVTFSTRLDPASPRAPSLVGVYAGANWHEREAAEMFGIEFDGHPDLTKLYLPDGFIGNPLRKSYPLLSREVKPWPGTVDVEAMPSTENPEA